MNRIETLLPPDAALEAAVDGAMAPAVPEAVLAGFTDEMPGRSGGFAAIVEGVAVLESQVAPVEAIEPQMPVTEAVASEGKRSIFRRAIGAISTGYDRVGYALTVAPNKALLALAEKHPKAARLAVPIGMVAAGAVLSKVAGAHLDMNHLFASAGSGGGHSSGMSLEAFTTPSGSSHAATTPTVLETVSHGGHSHVTTELTDYVTTTKGKTGSTAHMQEAYAQGTGPSEDLHYDNLPGGGVEVRIDPHQGTTLIEVNGKWVPVDLNKQQLYDAITVKVNGKNYTYDFAMDHGVLKIPGGKLSGQIADAIRQHHATDQIFFNEGHTREIVSTSVGDGHDYVVHGDPKNLFGNVHGHANTPAHGTQPGAGTPTGSASTAWWYKRR